MTVVFSLSALEEPPFSPILRGFCWEGSGHLLNRCSRLGNVFLFFRCFQLVYICSLHWSLFIFHMWSKRVLSDSLRPHGLSPTRFLHLWDFPGKNAGVGCRFPLHYISYRYLIYSWKVKYLKNISTKESDRTERLHLVNPNCSVYLNKHRTLWLLVATKGNKSKRKSPKGRGAGRRNNFYFLLHIYLIVIYKRE